MRLFFGSMAASLLVMLGSGCNTVSPDECWPNTSGGFGGSGTIPIGAGVGATYTFPNGDGCALTVTPLVSFWICSYPGG